MMREKGKGRRFKTACGKKKGVVSPGGWRVAGSWWPRTCRRDSTFTALDAQLCCLLHQPWLRLDFCRAGRAAVPMLRVCVIIASGAAGQEWRRSGSWKGHLCIADAPPIRIC